MPYTPEEYAEYKKMRMAQSGTAQKSYTPEEYAEYKRVRTNPSLWERFKAGFMNKDINQPKGLESGDIAEFAGAGGLETIGGLIGTPGGPVGIGAGAAAGKATHEAIRRGIGAFNPNSTDMGSDLGVVGRVAGEGLANALGAKYIPGLPKAIANAGNWGVKKAASLIFGPSTEAIEARIANPAAIQGAKTFGEIARTVPETLGKLESNISEYSKIANETLSDKVGKPANEIVNAIKQGIHKLDNSVGPAAQKAKGVLSGIQKDIESLFIKQHPTKEVYIQNAAGNLEKVSIPEMVDVKEVAETKIKGIIQDIDNNIDWDKPGAEVVNNALKGVRTSLDTTLKESNKAYAKAMEPVSRSMDLLSKSRSGLGVKKAVGGGYDYTETTVSKLKNLKGKEIAPELLDKLKTETGIDYNALVRDREIANEFLKSNIAGSRRTVPGAALGGMVGAVTGSPWAGSAIGSGMGYATDVLGSRALGKAIDITSPLLRANMVPKSIGKYSGLPLVQSTEELLRKKYMENK